MRPIRIVPAVTLLLAVLFASLSLLVRPLWYDVDDFLDTRVPIMLLVVVLGVLVGGYAAWLLRADALLRRRAWLHVAALVVLDAAMIALLCVFFTELGAETVMIWRNLAYAVPYVAWFGAIAALIVRPPKRLGVRLGALAGLAAAGALFAWLPARIALTSRPAAFLQQDGFNLVWATNARAISWVEFGEKEDLGGLVAEQEHGLKVTGDRVQRVFLPASLAGRTVFVRANVEGVRSIFPIDAVKTGRAQSGVVSFSLPGPGEPLAFVAFSDLHDQARLYRQLAAHVDWPSMDLAVYLGDLLNNVPDPLQFRRSLLDLATGGVDLPRVFVRGNHETRAEAARLLDEWMVGPGGEFYYAFEAGDVFFVVLDTGETYADDHVEFSGLVDFTSYHRRQAEWLAAVLASPRFIEARHRIVLAHIPPVGKDIVPAFSPVWDLLEGRSDIDLVVSGHTHRSAILPSEKTGLPFPVAICGGYPASSLAAVTVRVAGGRIDLATIGMDGKERERLTLEP